MSAAPHPFDEAVRLESLGVGRWSGATHGDYANMAGPFGGFTAAVLLKSVLSDPRCLAEPIALTVNFAGPIADGAFEVAARLIRGGKTTQHWSVELSQAGGVAATASVVCGVRAAEWSHAPLLAPAAPRFETLERAPVLGRPNWTRRYDMRFVEGGLEPYPRADGIVKSPRSLVWLKEDPERALDFLALASLSDAFFVRIMLARGTWQPMATVTMTTYFHLRHAELSALGAAPVLGDADAAVFEGGFADQSCRLWSEEGRLIANGVQATWYKS